MKASSHTVHLTVSGLLNGFSWTMMPAVLQWVIT